MGKTLQVDDLRKPTTKRLEGETLIDHLMRDYKWTREKAIASVKRRNGFALIPMKTNVELWHEKKG